MVKIVNADILEWCKKYRGEKFHALFCDAPYSLGDGKKGFMNKEWDNAIAMQPDTWRALAEHLLPGAFLFVFAGTLNDDLISVAMRQAGLRKFHKTINWAFGSGFPKASRIDTAIDREAGATREKTHVDRYHDGRIRKSQIDRKSLFGAQSNNGNLIELPATSLAKTWAGHRYGLQAIKPAAETILIFQKNYDGKPVDSIVKNGTGALWVDGARIGTNKIMQHGYPGEDLLGAAKGNGVKGSPDYHSTTGRWPANLILQHSPDCNGTCSPSCPCRELDEQSGESKSGASPRIRNEKGNELGQSNGWNKHNNKATSSTQFGDTGGASRFFYNADWNHEAAEQISNAAAVRYVAKAASTEKEKGLIGNIACLICSDSNTEHHIVCKDKKYHISMAGRDGIPTVNEIKRMWKNYRVMSKSGGKKAKQPQWALAECRRNNHPTVKPVSLCKYLATLLLPPAEYSPRRILVPFAGVASEAIGAMLAGWEEVTAIEKEKEYCEIGRARVKYWQNHKEPVTKKSKPSKVSAIKSAELFPELA